MRKAGKVNREIAEPAAAAEVALTEPCLGRNHIKVLDLRVEGRGGLFGRLTHRLEEADVFSQRAHAAAEGDDKHENPHDQQDNSRVHWQTGQSRLWKCLIDSFMHLYMQILHVKDCNKTEEIKVYLGHSTAHLPACFIMRAYTPMDTITMAITWRKKD